MLPPPGTPTRGGDLPSVDALAVSSSTVYVGGYFTTIGRQLRNNIAALDAATGAATAWNPNANNAVYALALSGSTVYAGGNFTTIGGQTRNLIAALDAATCAATAWNPNATGDLYYPTVRALAVSGSTVYAGGWFTHIGGQARNCIAALDAVTGAATAWNPNLSGVSSASTVYALAVSGSTVYAGGDFTTIGGQTRNNIAALDAATGGATAWNPNANGRLWALAVTGSKVYAGGWFTSIGGQSRYYIAALDAGTGAATVWNPNMRVVGGVYALSVFGPTVYVGGACRTVGGDARPHFAQFDTPPNAVGHWRLY